MTKEEVMNLYYSQTIIITKHTPLVVLTCATYDENEEHDDCWGDEFIFTVPIEWLVNYMNKLSGRVEWDWEKVQNWLQNEYIYDDSKPIFDQAILENVCVTCNF